jgi:hypothetical protein
VVGAGQGGVLWVLAPAILFASAGFFFGDTAGNFWARAAMVNAGAWCCLILYWWTAQILRWPAILRMLPYALPSYVPAVFGVFCRVVTTTVPEDPSRPRRR